MALDSPGATPTKAKTIKAKRGKGMMRAAPAKPAAIVVRRSAPESAALQQAKVAKRNLQPVKRAEPSSRYGRKKRAKVEKKQEKKDYSSFLCPGGSVACPAPVAVKAGSDKGVVERMMTPEELSRQLTSLADWFKIGFECMEFENELNSCGGCVTLGLGQVARQASAKCTNVGKATSLLPIEALAYNEAILALSPRTRLTSKQLLNNVSDSPSFTATSVQYPPPPNPSRYPTHCILSMSQSTTEANANMALPLQ
ncbi:hypothetical protein QFC21_004888 [Naganishia friedmannii]|uniref:Uncharacterized protein n=1 Tax=Naganishia friedmannii TaxID=89922 RepID=A0ACC2VDJ1_9TREE|nr:hypothetical protein QFC21_004888 [Naganishia friedmannii]